MQLAQNEYRGFWLLVLLNWDRALYIAMISLALFGGAWIITLLGHGPVILH
ncbi:MAG: hypothetical protein AAGF27_09405 [Pseudomonadota bacterium]